MIDCLIRILDWCGKEEINVDRLLNQEHSYYRVLPSRSSWSEAEDSEDICSQPDDM